MAVGVAVAEGGRRGRELADKRVGGFREDEAALLQGFGDDVAGARGDEDVVGEIGGDEEDGALLACD